MNYLTQNLKTRLTEYKNKFQESDIDDIFDTLLDFIEFVQRKPKIFSIVEELKMSEPYNDSHLSNILNNEKLIFSSSKQKASFIYQFICFLKDKGAFQDVFTTTYFYVSLDSDRKNAKTFKQLVIPLIHYLQDNLDEASSVIYLLEKYKKRTEWFTKDDLYEKYKDATKGYEGILEDDLRLFLFDQGIEYPFSSPKIGKNDRTDVVGNMETNDPLIVEVKIYDSSKNYKKNRIKEGFEQALSYANTYNKNIAYLTVFNVDDIDIVFDTEEFGTTFPSSITQGNITVYFVVIDIYPKKSSSTRKNPKKEIINKNDLI